MTRIGGGCGLFSTNGSSWKQASSSGGRGAGSDTLPLSLHLSGTRATPRRAPWLWPASAAALKDSDGMASGFKSGRSGLRLHAVVRGLLRRIDALSGKNGAAASVAGKSPAQRRIRGHVDVADLDGVVGWAFDTTDPSRRCEVEVVSNDGTIIAQGRADQQRDDLKRAGYADGEHGFRIKIPFEKSTMYASAVIRESQTQATLGTYTLPRFVAALDPASFDPESTHVTGWCIDRQNSKLRPKLVGVSGGREFPIGAASLYRPDLLTAGLGDGFSGFEFPKRVLHGMDTFSIVDARTDTAVVKDAQLDSGLGGKEAG